MAPRRKRKTPDSWREFLIEIAAVTLGVLLALGLEQAIEALHERGEAREARAAIDAEMQENLNRVAYRLGQQRCIDARLDEISRLLVGWTEGKALPARLTIGDPGTVPMVLQRWQANLNSGRFSRQSSKAQAEQAAFYTRLSVLDEVGRREHDTWAQLRVLEAGPGIVRTDLRPQLVSALQAAKSQSNDTRLLGQVVVDTARRAGLTAKPIIKPAVAGTTCQALVS